MGQLTIEQIVMAVNDLPPMPTVASKVFSLLKDPKVSVEAISHQIGLDQSLTAKVLKLANSAFYSYARRVSNISDAVVILGMNTIRNLVLTVSVQPTLLRSLDGYYMERGALWQHSIAVATASNLIARRCSPALADSAFVAGLLHDLGKLILDEYMKESYHEIIQKIHLEKVPFEQAEELVLGFTHADLGGRISLRWNLPGEIAEPIQYHHNPKLATKHAKLTNIVHLADAVALMMGMGIGGDGLMYNMESESLNLLNLKQEDIYEVASDMVSIVKSIQDAEEETQ